MIEAEQLAREINRRTGMVLLDWSELQKACLNKNDLIVRLLNILVQQTPGWISELQEFVREKDCTKIRKVCHRVKGALASLHADAGVESLEKLNSIARQNDENLVGAQDALDDVVSVLQKTQKAVSEILTKASLG